MTDLNQLELQVSISDRGATTHVSVSGDIDVAHANDICQVVSAACDVSETQCVVVDISNVDFMDSSGISALLECHDTLLTAGVRFELVGAGGHPLKLLQMTGVLDYLGPDGTPSIPGEP